MRTKPMRTELKDDSIDFCDYCEDQVSVKEPHGFQKYRAVVFDGVKDTITSKAEYKTYYPVFHTECFKQFEGGTNK